MCHFLFCDRVWCLQKSYGLVKSIFSWICQQVTQTQYRYMSGYNYSLVYGSNIFYSLQQSLHFCLFFICPTYLFALTFLKHPPPTFFFFYFIFLVFSPHNTITTKHGALIYQNIMWILQNICSVYSFCPRGVWSNWRQILCLTLFVWAVIFTRTSGWEACSLAPTALALRAKHEANVETQSNQRRAPHLGRSDALKN